MFFMYKLKFMVLSNFNIKLLFMFYNLNIIITYINKNNLLDLNIKIIKNI